jgi:hypothetical protein
MKPRQFPAPIMHSQTPPREQLIQAISNLSDRQVALLLQWVETLQKTPSLSQSDPSVDPLAEFVGANTHGNLASTIDKALYD